MTTAVGMIFGIPAARIKGLYLAIATLASQFILEDFFNRAEGFTGGSAGALAESFSLFGFYFDTDARYLYVVLFYVVLLYVAAAFRVQVGKQQWVIYRSLAKPMSRTFLGINLNSEFLVARFKPDGEIEPTIDVTD